MGMFGFGGDSTSSTAAEEIGTTDQARAVGGKKNTLATDLGKAASGKQAQIGALNIGAKGTLVSPGANQISGNKGTITIDNSSAAIPGIVQSFLDALSTQTTATTDALTNLLAGQSSTGAGALPDTTGQADPAAAGTDTPTETTDAESLTTWYYGLGILAAIVAVWFYLRHK